MHTVTINLGIRVSTIIGISVGGGMIAILLVIFIMIVIGMKLCCGDADSKAMDTGGTVVIQVVSAANCFCFFHRSTNKS